MAIKRSWEDDREVENLAMANCLMLLSRVAHSGSSPGRVFHCKTCNKEFNSFQALGGHRAGHKRPKLTDGNEVPAPAKAKTHECSICGLEFPIGQALGGHMRRHRDSAGEKGGRPVVALPAPLTEKLNGGKGLCLDLNLTPFENGLKAWRSSVKAAIAI